jgi:hypothetical protein
MDETLTWLRAPETEHALRDLMCGLIRDIRLLLVHPDLGNAAKLAAITQAVDQLAPPPGPEAISVQAAASVVALLARSSGPATLLFEELAGEPIRIELTGIWDRPLTPAECHELRIGEGAHGYERTGTLRTVDSGLAAAEVFSIVVPGRLPSSARSALGIPGPDNPMPPPSDVPLGKALAGFGVRREPLGARLVRGGPNVQGNHAVESAARMWLADQPVALAGERVTAEFCRRAAGHTAPAQAVPAHTAPTQAVPARAAAVEAVAEQATEHAT